MIVGILLGFLIGVLLFIWMASRHALSVWRKEMPAEKDADFSSWGAPWEELTARAQRAVDEAQAELPGPEQFLRKQARDAKFQQRAKSARAHSKDAVRNSLITHIHEVPIL